MANDEHVWNLNLITGGDFLQEQESYKDLPEEAIAAANRSVTTIKNNLGDEAGRQAIGDIVSAPNISAKIDDLEQDIVAEKEVMVSLEQDEMKKPRNIAEMMTEGVGVLDEITKDLATVLRGEGGTPDASLEAIAAQSKEKGGRDGVA